MLILREKSLRTQLLCRRRISHLLSKLLEICSKTLCIRKRLLKGKEKQFTVRSSRPKGKNTRPLWKVPIEQYYFKTTKEYNKVGFREPSSGDAGFGLFEKYFANSTERCYGIIQRTLLWRKHSNSRDRRGKT